MSPVVLTVCGHWLPRPPGSSGPGSTCGTAGETGVGVGRAAAEVAPPHPGTGGLAGSGHTRGPRRPRAAWQYRHPQAPPRAGHVETGVKPGQSLPLGLQASSGTPASPASSCLGTTSHSPSAPQVSLAARPWRSWLPAPGLRASAPSFRGLAIWARVLLAFTAPAHTPPVALVSKTTCSWPFTPSLHLAHACRALPGLQPETRAPRQAPSPSLAASPGDGPAPVAPCSRGASWLSHMPPTGSLTSSFLSEHPLRSPRRTLTPKCSSRSLGQATCVSHVHVAPGVSSAQRAGGRASGGESRSAVQGPHVSRGSRSQRVFW